MAIRTRRSGRASGTLAAVAVVGLVAAAPASAPSAATLRAAAGSVNPNGDGNRPSLNSDGALLAFDTVATNLGPADSNGELHDVYSMNPKRRGTLRLVSAGSDGVAGNRASYDAAVAANANIIAFTSEASTFASHDSNDVPDVYVRVGSGQPERISIASDGAQARTGSGLAAISANGNTVAFITASALVPADKNGKSDVYVRDRAAKATRLVSVSRSGTAGNRDSATPAISADGKLVSFASKATNLVAGDTNRTGDVFVRDLTTRRTTRISLSSRAEQQNRSTAAPFVQVSSLSRDGRYVAFDSDATNLVPGDANQDTDVFVRDRRRGITSRVSVDASGMEGDNDSFNPIIDLSGTRVAFESFAENLAPGDAAREDLFVYDARTRAPTVIDVSSTGAPRGLELTRQLLQIPALSGDGLTAAFVSGADNLVASDRNGLHDVFVRDLSPRGLRVRISGAALRTTSSRRPSVTVTASKATRVHLLCRIDHSTVPCRSGRAFRLPFLVPGRHTLRATAGGPGSLFDPRPATQTIVVRP